MNSRRKSASSANFSRPRSRSRSRAQPSPPSARVTRAARRGLHCSSQRLGVIPFVLFWNLPGKEGVEFREEVLAQQLGVQRRDPVHGVRAHDGEVRHPHPLLAVLLDQRAGPLLVVVARPFRLAQGHDAHVDLVDDLEVARQHALEERDAPTSRAPRGAACGSCSPASRVVMSQAASHAISCSSIRIRMSSATAMAGWVSLSWIATLSGKFFHEFPGDRKWRRMMSRIEHATKKYCWTSLQLLPVLGLVVRIKDLGDGLADGLLADGVDVAARIERRQVEVVGRARGPEAQDVHGLRAEPGRRGCRGGRRAPCGSRPTSASSPRGRRRRLRPGRRA